MIPSKDLRIQSTCNTLLTYKNLRCGRVVSFWKVAEYRNSPINIECMNHKGSLQKSIFFLHSSNFARSFCSYSQKCVDDNISQARRKLLLTCWERLSPTRESLHESYWIWTLDPPHFVAYHVSLPSGIVTIKKKCSNSKIQKDYLSPVYKESGQLPKERTWTYSVPYPREIWPVGFFFYGFFSRG